LAASEDARSHDEGEGGEADHAIEHEPSAAGLPDARESAGLVVVDVFGAPVTGRPSAF